MVRREAIWPAGTQGRRFTAGPLVALIALALAAGSVQASTITVANTDDSGPGSLRAALATANYGDLILVPPGTYDVTSGQLDVTDAVTIRGAGARRTAVRSDGGSRVLAIAPALSEVTISGLTITGGHSGTDDGAGIQAWSNLALTGVAVVGNRANPDGSVGNGGGIWGSSAATLAIRSSLIAGNTAYNGGGVHVSGAFSLINSTVSGNTAGTPNSNGDGGGMQLNEASAIVGSTVAGNRAFDGAPEAGAGIFTFNDGEATLRNSIVARNIAYQPNGMAPDSVGNPGSENNCGTLLGPPAVIDQGHNIESSSQCGLTEPNSRQDTDPRLLQLADNGGETDTMALRPGSQAVNAGSGCAARDQRGLPRTLGLGRRCDIGAYELARCGGAIVNRVGTNGPDRLVGTNRRDGIVGLAGRDSLFGRGGNDSLCGLNGGDVLYGQRGHDLLLGGRGHDRGFAGLGRDRLLGQLGNDLLVGGLGFDRAFGGPGQDRLLGLGHRDLLFGGVGLDRLYGGPAPDLLNGGPGPDFCHGGPARDRAGRCAVRVRI